MTKTFKTTAKAAVIAALLSSVATGAFAQDAREARIKALEEQVAALAEQISALKESTTAADNDIRTIATATPVTITNGKPVIASADGNFSANLHGVFQFDAANYNQKSGLPAATVGPDLNSGANFRRARIGIDGKLFGAWDYNLLFDFGGTGTEAGGAGTNGAALHEGWIQYSGFKIANTYPVRIRAGAFAPSLGLEDAASTNGSLFLERPSSAEIARSIAGADKRVGVQVQSNGDHWLAAAAWTGAKTGDLATFDEQSSYTARVAGTPLFGYDWRLHIGANASYIARPAQTTALSNATTYTLSDRPELRVDGTQLVTTGAIDAKHVTHYGAELAYQKGPLLIQGEYFNYEVERRTPVGTGGNPNFSGWYVEGGYVLTGDARKYNNVNGAFDAPAIANVFDRSTGKWGAVELVARYSITDLNFNEGVITAATPLGGVRGGEQEIIAVGVNWFPNPAVKFGLQYQDVSIDRLNGAGVQIGQDYNTVALRSQFSF